MRQSFLLHLGRKPPGGRAQTVLVEVSLALESQSMTTEEQMQLLGTLSQRASLVVQETFGGEQLPLPQGQQERG